MIRVWPKFVFQVTWRKGLTVFTIDSFSGLRLPFLRLMAGVSFGICSWLMNHPESIWKKYHILNPGKQKGVFYESVYLIQEIQESRHRFRTWGLRLGVTQPTSNTGGTVKFAGLHQGLEANLAHFCAKCCLGTSGVVVNQKACFFHTGNKCWGRLHWKHPKKKENDM